MSDKALETCTLTMSSSAWAALCVFIQDAAADPESPLYSSAQEAANALDRFYTKGEGTPKETSEALGFMSGQEPEIQAGFLSVILQ